MYWFIRSIVYFFSCKILFRVSYENEEIANKYAKCIICPNHSRIFDPIFVYPKIQNMYAVAKSELFEKKYLANFLKYHNVLPIKREQKDFRGMKNIIKLFKHHDKIRLLLFPEGRVIKDRSDRGQIKNGAVHIAAYMNIPIIPVYITARPKFFSKVIVKFGSPIFPNKEVLHSKEALNNESKKLLNTIYMGEI